MQQLSKQDTVSCHLLVHQLAALKRVGVLVPISTQALVRWHKEVASELIRHGQLHQSPLTRAHIQGVIGQDR